MVLCYLYLIFFNYSEGKKKELRLLDRILRLLKIFTYILTVPYIYVQEETVFRNKLFGSQGYIPGLCVGKCEIYLFPLLK